MNGWKTIASAALSIVYGIGGYALGLHDEKAMMGFVVAGGGLLGLGSKVQKLIDGVNGKQLLIFALAGGMMIAPMGCASIVPIGQAVIGILGNPTIAKVSVEGAGWIKATMDDYFNDRCKAGEIGSEHCEAWNVVSALSKSVIDQAQVSIDAKQSGGTVITVEQQKAVEKDLVETAASLVEIYAGPHRVVDISKKEALK